MAVYMLQVWRGACANTSVLSLKIWSTHYSSSLFYRYSCNDCVMNAENGGEHIKNLWRYLRSSIRMLYFIFLFCSVTTKMFAVLFLNYWIRYLFLCIKKFSFYQNSTHCFSECNMVKGSTNPFAFIWNGATIAKNVQCAVPHFERCNVQSLRGYLQNDEHAVYVLHIFITNANVSRTTSSLALLHI